MTRSKSGIQRLIVVNPQGLVMALALTLTSSLGSSAHADPIQVTYSTEGVVGLTSLDGAPVVYGGSPLGSAGIAGAPAISFRGVTNGTLTTGQPFDLGQFVVGPVPAGTTTTYTQTPFQIAFTEQTVNGVAPSPNQTPIVLDGWLNGTVTAGSQLHLAVSFNAAIFPAINLFDIPLPPPLVSPFQTGSLLNDFTLTNQGNDGQMIQAALYTEQVAPEPTTLVCFACVSGFLVYRWRVNARQRKRPSAS